MDVGTGDSNLEGQLRPEALEQSAKGNSKLHLDLRLQVRQLPRPAAAHPSSKSQLTMCVQPDYGHDYGFIATYMDDHIQARLLRFLACRAASCTIDPLQHMRCS